MSLPHSQILFEKWTSEAPRPQAGASREGNIVLIVPLDPAYRTGFAGHLPAKSAP